MKLFKRMSGLLLLSVMLMISTAPAVHAQSVLDDIKGRLEEEGIAVVDYSTPEGAWGAIPPNYIRLLQDADYSNLQEFAAEYEDFYIGPDSLTDLRRRMAIAVAEKSTLTLQSEINEKDDEIRGYEADIQALEGETKSQLASEIGGFDFTAINVTASPAIREDLSNLLFQEIDFYYNYSKWGRLPLRIIGILESETDYQSLAAILDTHDLKTEAGVEALRQELAGIQELSADDQTLIVNSTLILMSSGEAQLSQVGRAVADTIKNLAGGLAVIWIIIAAARMIFAQGDETIITEQKRAITYGIIGLITILLIDRMVDILYGPAGIIRNELITDEGVVIGAQAFSQEVYGIINFIKALIGTVAILYIIISGVRMLFATGEEDQLTQQKKSLLWVGVGLILIAIDEIVVEQFFIQPTTQQSDQLHSTNIARIIDTFGTVLQFLLGFVGLISFGALIYGSATMIMNYGNDEMVENAKKIIRNAIVGIIVILSAYTIVASLVVFQ